jgi:TonB family protein
MRRLPFLILLLLFPISALAASYEARSPRHLITIEPVSLEGGEVRYDMTISDVATGKVLGTPSFSSRGPKVKSIDVGALHIAVHIGNDGSSLAANVAFVQGDDVVDEIHADWMLKSRRARLHPTDAVRMGTNVKAPLLVRKVEPVYPEEARLARVSGKVIVEIVIDRTGHVTDAVVLESLPFGLSEAALDAVKQWVFEPATQNGSPVNVIFNLTVNFKLETPVPGGN